MCFFVFVFRIGLLTFASMHQSEELLNTYLEYTCDPESALLKRINRETYLKETMPHMLSGHYQGRVLSFLSKMARPKRILEIGTFTGYATVCLAEGLDETGEMHTIDINAELEDRVKGYFDESPHADQIHYHLGDAMEVIADIPGYFDLVFIDADKKRNLQYYELLVDRVPSGGLIMIDNVLWKGKVLQGNPDNQTKQVLELNERLKSDQRVEKLILPIRDGLFVLRKK
jgi:caffeoyl-CoA O-methyltransferase